jgi:hypothetical protein
MGYDGSPSLTDGERNRNTLKKSRLVPLVIALAIASQACSPSSANNESHLPDVNAGGQYLASLPVLDPQAPLPSPGAAQLRSLLADEPGIDSLIDDVEMAEQAALQAALADLQAQLGSAHNSRDPAPFAASPFGALTLLIPSSAGQSTTDAVSLASYSQPRAVQPADAGLSAASVIGLLSSAFSDMLSGVQGAVPTRSYSKTEKAGNVTTDMSMEIGKSQDGSSHFGMGLKTEGTENGVTVKSDMSATIDGQRCPTADGQVSFSIRARLSSESGGTGSTQDLTTFVRATVNDDAEISSSTYDVEQGAQQTRDGRQVYVETGATVKYGPGFTGYTESNWRVNQKTDNATGADVNDLGSSGLAAALELGLSSLISAQQTWQSGGCVKIVATSPGTVQPGSTTVIPVNVISIFDGGDAPSKLTAVLTGAESIDPTLLPRTPGSLSYTAPNEAGKSATILLTATSKRGKAKLELSANTGGAAYRIVGGLDDWQTDTSVCDIMKPFALTSPILTLQFSGGLSGTYSYSGGPFNASGGDSYAISLPDGIGKRGTMTGGGTGCVDSPRGTFCNDGAEQYTLEPLAPGASCTQ